MNLIEMEDEIDDEILICLIALCQMRFLVVSRYLLSRMILNDDDVEMEKIDHRCYPRRKKRRMDFDRVRLNLYDDYFRTDHIETHFNGSEFKLMFRITRYRFELIAQSMAARSPFFTERADACGQNGASIEAKLMLVFKTLGYGKTTCSHRDYFQMSKTLARETFNTFVDLSKNF